MTQSDNFSQIGKIADFLGIKCVILLKKVAENRKNGAGGGRGSGPAEVCVAAGKIVYLRDVRCGHGLWAG
jgi:hypothetical protein